MQTTPKANNILGHFFALLGAVVMLAIATWVSASSSQQVQPLDNLAVPRTGHTATALSDGRILITGGRDGAGNLVAASEIFDPVTQTTSASETLNTARVDHSATVLANGKVLVAGGTGASGPLSSAEIFDPATGGFTTLASAMNAARTRHTATLLNDGKVLIAGGDATGTGEIFDPASQTFLPTLWPLTMVRSGHTATLFTDNSVLLAGGNTATMETYTAGSGFTLDSASMSVVRTGHWAFELSDTRLLLFQGDTGNTIDEFNPTAGTITPKGSLDFHATSSSLLANGKLLVLGTGVAGLYDPNVVPPAPDFTAFDETSVPHSGILPRSGQSAVTVPGDKRILITGGVDGANQLLGQALFNPAKIWTDKDDYAPDDPVILSGSGWKPNENIYLYAVDNETEQWTYETTISADANGGFSVSPFFIVQLRHLGVQFHVTALGAQSTLQADVKFTDAGNFGYTPGSFTQTIAAGSNASFSQQITDPKNNDPLTAAPVVTASPGGTPLPATWVSTSPTSLSFGSTSGSNPAQTLPWTVTVTVPSNAAGGTYTGNIKAHATGSGATPGDGQGTNLSVTVPPQPAAKIAVSGSTANLASGSTRVLTATIQDANGNTITTGPDSTLSVTFSKTGGTGTVTGLGASTASGGIATITVTGNQTGSITIGASNGALTAGTGNPISFNVVAGTATKLAFVQQPTTTTAGQTITPAVTVQIQDANGNLINSTASIGIAIQNNAGGGTLSGGAPVNAVNGTATFSNLSIDKAGNAYTLQATSTGLTAVTSTGFNITAGTATKLAFVQQPTTTTAAQSITPAVTVQIQDANGNLTNSTASIGIAIQNNAGGGTLSGGAPVNAVNGTATFSNLSINKIGTGYTLQATSTGLTAATSSAFNITVGTATQVRVETAADGSGTVVPAQTVNSGSSITVFSISRDAGGNFVANVAADSWSLANITGGVVAGDLVPAGNAKSAVFTGHLTGSANIHATSGVLTTTDSGTITVGAGTATRLVITGSATQTAGNSQNLTITAKDAGGNTVTSYTGPKSLTFSGANPSTNPVTNPTVTNNTGTAVNFGSPTAITFTNGVATVSGSSNGSMTLFKAETAIIAANDGAGATSAGADRLTVTVSAGTLNQFALSLTSPQSNGAAFTGANTLTALDSWGNTVTGFNAATDNVTIVANAPLVGTVSGLGSGGNNVLNQAGNFVSGVANLTTLGMKYTGSLGTGTFTATSSTGKVGTSGSVTINAGALDHFKVEAAGGGPIGTQTQNTAFNIMITAQDAGNNTVTSFSGTGAGGTVMLTSTPIGLSGAPVQTTAFTNGVLSSFSVTITNSGTFTITAAGFGGNVGKTGTSNSFVVNPSTVNTTTTVASSLNPSVYGQSVTFTATVAAASGTNNPTGTVTFTIDGTPGAPVSLGACSPAVAGTACASTSTSTLNVPGSPHTVSAAYTHTGNFSDSSGSLTGGQTVNKATPTATLSVTNSPVTYNGSPQAATVSITASSVPGVVANVKYNGSGTAPTNVATYTVTADFVPTDTANYNTLTNQSGGSFEIQKATPTATLSVTNSPATYNGSPQAAIVSISASSVPGSVANVKYNGSGTAPTNVATYAVTADFVPTDTANYNTLTDQSAGNFVIQKATPTATLIVTNSPVTYTGLPQAAIVGISASSTSGTVANVKYNGSSTVPTNAATYAVTADFVPTDTANYNTLTNHSAGNFVIDKANANVVVTPYTCPGTTYNGLTHTATYTISGVNGETGAAVGTVDVTDTVHTHANIYNGDQWTFTGAANYKDQSGTVDDCISAVTLTASIIGDPTRPYNGNTTATLTFANFSLTGLVGSESFTVTQTAGTYNSKDVATANNVTATLSAGDFTPAAGTLASDYVLPTTASGPGHISPLTLTASIINDPTRPYNGNTTATLTSANFSLTPQVGSESFTVTQTAGTYNSKDVAAANTVTASLTFGDFTPTGGAVASNYTLPTTASGPGHITPVPLTASIILNPTRPYNCTTVATLTSANFSLSGLIGSENFTVSQTVGAYNSKDVVSAISVSASLAPGDFTGTNGGIANNYVLPTSASGAGHITPTNASISVTAYTSATTTYNCFPHTATGSATGCDGNLSSLLDLSGTTHTNAGTYNNDPWTFNNGGTNPNYNSASGTVNDSIAKADATITVNPYHVTYDCNPHTSTGIATGVCSDSLTSLLHLPASHTDAGDYPSDGWTFDGNTNYNATSGTVHNQIDKANTASSVTSSVNPSTLAQPVTFTATVAGNPAVTCKPTGTVTFKDGATSLGTGTLNGSGQATFSTSSLSAGSHSITAVYGADSNFNGSTSSILTQSVQYIFIGFLPPIDNLPILNTSKAGQTIPVKWQLKDYNGNLIGDLSTLAPNGLGSQPIACDSHDPLDDIEELSAPGATVFRYDGTQFIYNWQTSKPWANTCRLLVVTLADGTVHTAQFKFK